MYFYIFCVLLDGMRNLREEELLVGILIGMCEDIK